MLWRCLASLQREAMMPDNPETAASKAIAQARATLRESPTSPFTPNAFRAFLDAVDEFITDLMDESHRIAKRHKSEVISERYVQAASSYLIASRARRLFRHMGTVGGILLGGALSNILAMAQAGTAFPVLGTIVSIGVGIIGTFLVALHIAKD